MGVGRAPGETQEGGVGGGVAGGAGGGAVGGRHLRIRVGRAGGASGADGGIGRAGGVSGGGFASLAAAPSASGSSPSSPSHPSHPHHHRRVHHEPFDPEPSSPPPVPAGAAAPSDALRIGVVTDVQYADIPDGLSFVGNRRYYRNALVGLRRAVAGFGTADVDFAMHLGDIVDMHNAFAGPEVSQMALDRVLEAFGRLPAPTLHTLGNHCLYNIPRGRLNDALGIDALRAQEADRERKAERGERGGEERGGECDANDNGRTLKETGCGTEGSGKEGGAAKRAAPATAPFAPPVSTAAPSAPSAPPVSTAAPSAPSAPPVSTAAPSAPSAPPVSTAAPSAPSAPPAPLAAPSAFRAPPPLASPLPALDPQSAPSYYSYVPASAPSWRIVVLDAYDVSLLGRPASDPRRAEALRLIRSVNRNRSTEDPTGLVGLDRRFVGFGGGVGDEQVAWLRAQLEDCRRAGQRALIAGHLAFYPPSILPICLMYNYDVILDLLWQYPDVVKATLCGHAHKEGYARDPKGIHHRVFAAILETEPGRDCYGVLHVRDDGIFLEGHGAIVSQWWPFS